MNDSFDNIFVFQRTSVLNFFSAQIYIFLLNNVSTKIMKNWIV